MELSDLNKLLDALEIERRSEKELKDHLSEQTARKKAIESEIMKALEANGLQKFAGANISVSIVTSENISMPEDPQRKQMVLDYFKDRGVFDHYATIHYSTLNSFFREESEIELSKGNCDFKIPGIEEVKTSKYLKVY